MTVDDCKPRASLLDSWSRVQSDMEVWMLTQDTVTRNHESLAGMMLSVTGRPLLPIADALVETLEQRMIRSLRRQRDQTPAHNLSNYVMTSSQ